MFIELPCSPCVGVSRGVMYIGKGDGTYEELCSVTDIPEFTSGDAEEAEEIQRHFNYDRTFSGTIDIDLADRDELIPSVFRPTVLCRDYVVGTKTWRHLRKMSFGWKNTGPIRKRTISLANTKIMRKIFERWHKSYDRSNSSEQ